MDRHIGTYSVGLNHSGKTHLPKQEEEQFAKQSENLNEA
jgi:hypothetical protein